MEGGEVPKVPGSIEQTPENKELQLKATELAKATREKGMGFLTGNFPSEYVKQNGLGSQWGGQLTLGEFVQGEKKIPLLRRGITYDLLHARGQQRRQILMLKQYTPPKEVEEVTEFQDVQKKEKHLGFITRTRTFKEPVKVRRPTGRFIGDGKYGTGDWIQYDYLMKVVGAYDAGGTPGYVNMSIAVPPEIAVQINEQVKENVYFPDAYFKALYPDLEVGTDTNRQLRRLEATELEVIDERQKSRKQEVRKYPQPIPY